MLESKISRKLTFHARHSLKMAGEIARAGRAEMIETKHLLLALYLERGSLGSILLENMGFKEEKLNALCLDQGASERHERQIKVRHIAFSEQLKVVITRAYSLARSFSYPYVGSEHLMYALVESRDSNIKDILKTLNIEKKKVRSILKAHLGSLHFPHFSRMLELPEMGFTKNKNTSGSNTPFLDQYGLDITRQATEHPEKYTGRVRELSRMIHILGRKNKNNPLLIGEPGVGKTTLVSALAQGILSGTAGSHLSGKRIIALDMALIVAGTNFRGEFEARLKEILHEAETNPDIILFIDEIHSIIGAGNTSGGLDAANILKPALSRGTLQCIGATTLAEYKRYIEKDPAFERRFQAVSVAEPSPAEAREILGESRESYEVFHRVTITPEAIGAAVDFAVRFLPDRFLPDKAFDLLDEAAAGMRKDHPDNDMLVTLRELEKERATQTLLKDELVSQEKYEEAHTLQTKERLLSQEIETIKTTLKKQVNSPGEPLTALDIARTVSHMTRIPLEKLISQENARVTSLTAALETQLIGQTEAIEKLTNTLLRAYSGLGSPDRPLGSFLFLGPTGVGKTLSAKLLASHLFEDPQALIRLDMSEFMERHSLAQMIGAPAGYIGYGEGGKLTEKVRHKPYSVVLFDEIEKAHPDVFNILLQILDEGLLTDAEGRSVSFRNTLIILTSNIGTQAFTAAARLGFREKGSVPQDTNERFESVRTEVLESLKHSLRPELLARLDHTVVFRPLSPIDLEKIVRLELETLKTRAHSRGLKLRFDRALIRHLSTQSNSPEQGARLVRKNIRETVENFLAKHLLAHAKNTKTLTLSVKDGKITASSK